MTTNILYLSSFIDTWEHIRHKSQSKKSMWFEITTKWFEHLIKTRHELHNDRSRIPVAKVINHDHSYLIKAKMKPRKTQQRQAHHIILGIEMKTKQRSRYYLFPASVPGRTSLDELSTTIQGISAKIQVPKQQTQNSRILLHYKIQSPQSCCELFFRIWPQNPIFSPSSITEDKGLFIGKDGTNLGGNRWAKISNRRDFENLWKWEKGTAIWSIRFLRLWVCRVLGRV